jgi:hypothetical protein
VFEEYLVDRHLERYAELLAGGTETHPLVTFHGRS